MNGRVYTRGGVKALGLKNKAFALGD